jgi:protoporphyrinogen/coproporphyrinogen III oxidase
VHLGFLKSAIKSLPKGFGFLVPASEKRSFLGVIWDSNIFPFRAPDNIFLCTVILGEAEGRSLFNLVHKKLAELAEADLRELLGASGGAEMRRWTIWEDALPKHNLGYRKLLEELAHLESANPGLYLVGNYRGGAGVKDCVNNSFALANRIQEVSVA